MPSIYEPNKLSTNDGVKSLRKTLEIQVLKVLLSFAVQSSMQSLNKGSFDFLILTESKFTSVAFFGFEVPHVFNPLEILDRFMCILACKFKFLCAY